MTCSDCKCAQAEPRTAAFQPGCTSCKARALAATGAHDASTASGHMTVDFIDVLKTMFGADWMEGSGLVKHWAGLVGQWDAQQKAKRA